MITGWQEPTQLLDRRYQLGPVIAEGATAVVYRATDTRLGRVVAIKRLRPHLVADHDFVARFAREARATAALAHLNVVTIFDWHADSQSCYLVLEYVDGESLLERQQRLGMVPPTEAVRIMRQVLDALDAAHTAGFVHRDVKPANILIARDGLVKLGDFGIARLEGVGNTTRPGEAVGTPHYMAPEQVSGAYVGPATDIYAVGAVMYELLTGRTPFGGETTEEIALRRLTMEPAPIADLAPGLPRRLALIVAKALNRNPNERWISAAAMRSALDQVVAAASQSTERFAAVTPRGGTAPLPPASQATAPREMRFPAGTGRIAAALAAILMLVVLASTLSAGASSQLPPRTPAPATPTAAPPDLLGPLRPILIPASPTRSATPAPSATSTRAPSPTPSPTRTATAIPPPSPTPAPVTSPATRINVGPVSTAEMRIQVPQDATTVAVSISVRGGRNDIRVTALQGNKPLGPAELVTGDRTLVFRPDKPGQLRIVFDNTFSLITSKAVTVTYQIDPRR